MTRVLYFELRVHPVNRSHIVIQITILAVKQHRVHVFFILLGDKITSTFEDIFDSSIVNFLKFWETTLMLVLRVKIVRLEGIFGPKSIQMLSTLNDFFKAKSY